MSDDVGDPKRKEEVMTSDQRVAGKDWNWEKKAKEKRLWITREKKDSILFSGGEKKSNNPGKTWGTFKVIGIVREFLVLTLTPP